MSRFAKHFHLLVAMTKRDIRARYRPTVGGWLWLVLAPLMSLAIYTFAFTVIFQAKWTVGQPDDVPYVLSLYAGLIVFTAFSEPISRAPTLFVVNANLVKRVVFPLEILPLMAVGTALVSAFIQAGILVAVTALWLGFVPWTAILLPFIWIPVILLAVGFAFALASVGAYMRDISLIVGILVTAAMFLSPVFYPVEAVPEWLRPVYGLNPLTTSIEQTRGILLRGILPSIAEYLSGLLVGAVAAGIGVLLFAWTREGFADAL